jgi:hypothetical protein
VVDTQAVVDDVVVVAAESGTRLTSVGVSSRKSLA